MKVLKIKSYENRKIVGIMIFLSIIIVIGYHKVNTNMGIQKFERLKEKRIEVAQYEGKLVNSNIGVFVMEKNGDIDSRYTEYVNDNSFDFVGTPVEVWKNIDEIKGNTVRIVGRKSNGQVLYWGRSLEGMLEELDQWENIESIGVYFGAVLGTRSDGNILSAGYQGEEQYKLKKVAQVLPSAKKKVAAISSTMLITLDSEGTVFVADFDDESDSPNMQEISDFKGVIDISADFGIVLGLKENGRVLYMEGINIDGFSEIQDLGYDDVVQIASQGGSYAVLHLDGTVSVGGDFAEEHEEETQEVESWKNIIHVYPDGDSILGLKEDGTLVIAGEDVPDVSGLQVFE